MIVSGELHSFRTALVRELLNRTVFTYQHGPHFRVARLQEIGQLLGVLGLLGRTVATVPLYHFGEGRCKGRIEKKRTIETNCKSYGD